MAEFDLSAERAKRSRETKTLILRGENGEVLSKYELAAEFPVTALDAGVAGRLGEALRALFVDPDEAEDFLRQHQPSVADFLAIMRHAYGLAAPGEASASGS